MPRLNRVAVGNVVYHCLNRANDRQSLFASDKEFQHFISLLEEGRVLIDMRILAFVIMPNHWHLVLYPRTDGDLGEFMRWVTTTHVRQRRVQTKSVGYGHIYQGSYKSFPVSTDKYLIDLIRYVEQNPLRAKLVDQAQNWRWSSLWIRQKGNPKQKKLLATLPTTLPSNYLQSVNTILGEDITHTLHNSIEKGTPFGSRQWIERTVKRFNMESTVRRVGRPRKIL